MRTLLCLTVAVLACGGSDSNPPPPTDSQTVASTVVGPDPLFLRIPRAGGPARVVAFPNVDSAVWTSSQQSPAPGRVLGFDDDAGMITMVDAKSRPMHIDFRRDSIEVRGRAPIAAAVSIDGSTIYGVTTKGGIVRTTPTGEWIHDEPRSRARGVLPLRDGSALIWSDRDTHAMLTRIRPEAAHATDSLSIPLGGIAGGTGVGDRLYFVDNDQLYAVQTRTLEIGPALDVGGPVTALAVTPSGDRVYAIATIDGRSSLVAIDRYRWRITSRLPLDTKARELRVDPIGRYVLVRGTKDSVAIVAVGTNKVVGVVRSDWRDDLPLVAPDGSIATARDHDVIFVHAEGQPIVARIVGGTSDFWFALWWTGFRPRAASLDVPVKFDSISAVADSAATAAVVKVDTVRAPATVVESVPPKPAGFTVSFFALLSLQRAQSEADKIRVGNDVAHVETVLRSGVPVYRVILGPYPTCADAQRAAKASGKTAWIPEGGCEVPPANDEPLAR